MLKRVQTPGEYLQSCRDAIKPKRMSARRLSLTIGAEESYISAIERRNIVPDAPVLAKIERALPGFSGLRMSEIAIERARAASAA